MLYNYNYILLYIIMIVKVSKEAKIRNLYNQVLHLTQDTTRESDKNTIKNHTQVSPFQAGDHKAAMNRQESMTNTKHKY